MQLSGMPTSQLKCRLKTSGCWNHPANSSRQSRADDLHASSDAGSVQGAGAEEEELLLLSLVCTFLSGVCQRGRSALQERNRHKTMTLKPKQEQQALMWQACPTCRSFGM